MKSKNKKTEQKTYKNTPSDPVLLLLAHFAYQDEEGAVECIVDQFSGKNEGVSYSRYIFWSVCASVCICVMYVLSHFVKVGEPACGIMSKYRKHVRILSI